MVVKVDEKHDFTMKLRQPSVLSRVKEYVRWQQKVRMGVKIEVPNLTPISLNLDLTTACNFQCGHCIDLGMINSKGKYDHDTLLVSLTNMIEHGLCSVIIIGGGEPTLYPRFVEIVRFLKNRGIKIAISSNGSQGKVLYSIIKYLKPEDKDWLRLSLDAGINDTWQKIHKPVSKNTLEEICAWVPKMRNLNPQLSIGFSFVITWGKVKNEKRGDVVENIDEIITATKLARKYGFSYISLKPFLTRFESNSVETINPIETSLITRISKVINKAKEYETNNFKVIESTNLKVLKDNNWRDFTHQPKTCHIAAFRQVLSPVGLFHCPGFRGIEKSYIGDKNIYCNDNAKKAIVNILSNFNASKECVDCTCLFNQVNWWIEKAINGEIDVNNIKPTEERFDYFF